ncbi:MAG: VaFE repeat-containing surface-anchored protein [Clostridium sp.]|nr:VaFE repeat-containing surface-anchored protein [Clostridium sp.]
MLRRKRITSFLVAVCIVITAFFGNCNISHAAQQPEGEELCGMEVSTEQGTEEPYAEDLTEASTEENEDTADDALPAEDEMQTEGDVSCGTEASTEQGTEEPCTEATEALTEEKENTADDALPAESETQPEDDVDVEDLIFLMQEIMLYATVDTNYTFNFYDGGSLNAVCENEHAPVVAHTSGGNQIHCIDAGLSSAFQWTNYGWQSGGLTWSLTEINDGMADVLFEYYKGDNPNRSVSGGETSGGTGSLYNQLTHDLDVASGRTRTAPTKASYKIVNASNTDINGQTINSAVDTVNNVQKTETLTFLTGTTYLHHYVTVPAGVTMHYTPYDTGVPAMATNTTVALVNNSTAYFTAPLTANITVSISSTCINRDFNKGYYIGSMYILAPQGKLTSTTTGSPVDLQRFMYCDGLTASESFSVHFSTSASLAVQKVSANPAVTDGNGCYSLENAVYGVYASRADAQADSINADGSLPANTKRLAAIRTDAAGNGKAENMAYPSGGVFYAKELAAPKGYALDPNVYTANAVSGGTATLRLTDLPQLDPASILVEKKGSRGVPLADAEFTIKYYDVQTDADPALSGLAAKRTWVLRTSATGDAYLDERYKASGDDFYYSAIGNPALPIGTITIQETKAPEGYYIDDTVYVRQVTSSGNLEQINTYNAPVVTDSIIPGKIVINKTAEIKSWNEETGEFDISAAPMKDAVFGIYAAEDIYVNGSGAEIAYGKDSLVDTVTTDERGHAVSTDLYVEKYVVREIGTPSGYEPAGEVAVTISSSDNITTAETEGGQTEGYIETVNILNKLTIVKIETTAWNDATGNSQGSISESCSITDRAKISGLVPGRDYMLRGSAVDKATGELLSIASEKEFTAAAEYEEIDVKYTFNSLKLEGHDIVFYEYLYYDGALIALHEDIEDEGQTIHFPKIRTTAKDSVTGTSQGTASKNCTLIDIVSYSNLIPGKEYTLKAVVMDKETGNPLAINGTEVTAEKTFTAETAEGQADMSVTFDASALAGKDVVFFEYLYHEGIAVTMHADVEDENQTISFPPEIPPETPPTGDGTPIVFLLLTILASLAGMILIYRKKRKESM